MNLPADVCPLPPEPPDLVVHERKRGELTGRQRQVLDVVASYREARGRSPTMREIGRALGIGSTNGVNDHLRALERKGWIEREGGMACGIKIVPQPGREARAVLLAWRLVVEKKDVGGDLRRVLLRMFDTDPEFRALVGHGV